jgi:hypothetical protein
MLQALDVSFVPKAVVMRSQLVSLNQQLAAIAANINGGLDARRHISRGDSCWEKGRTD